MSNSPELERIAELVREGRQFWSSPRGQALRQAERACLGPLSDRWFGAHGLELGLGATLADICPIRHLIRWVPCLELADVAESLVCRAEELPLPDDCLDLVVIHHLLEVTDEPHRLLQEAARVTADDGHLVIFGWSPLAPTALARLWSRTRRDFSNQGRWRTPSRLADWLAFVDFEVHRVDYCGFRLPGRPARNASLEVLGRRHNLPLGDCYMIHARRRSLLARPNQGQLAFPGAVVGHAMNGATRLGKQPKKDN
jgi:SAM-dependent methyltransferase